MDNPEAAESKKWRLIGGRIPRAKKPPEIRLRRGRPRKAPTPVLEAASGQIIASQPSGTIQANMPASPSDFEHLAGKKLAKNQRVWALTCLYSHRGAHFGVDPEPYIVEGDPIHWKDASKWSSYRVRNTASGIRFYYECNLFLTQEEALEDAQTRNSIIK